MKKCRQTSGLVIAAFALLSCLGCASPAPMAAEREPVGDTKALLAELKKPEHYVVTVPGNSSQWEDTDGLNYGPVMPQIKSTESGLVERVLINDTSPEPMLLSDPMLLTPMLEWTDPKAALTAMYVYEQVLRDSRSQYIVERLRAGPWIMPIEKMDPVFEAMRKASIEHFDTTVRLRCVGILTRFGQQTLEDLDRWLDDPSADVRSFVSRAVEGVLLTRGLDTSGTIFGKNRPPRESADYIGLLIKHLYDRSENVSRSLYRGINSAMVDSIGEQYGRQFKTEGAEDVNYTTHVIFESNVNWFDKQRKLLAWWNKDGRKEFLELANRKQEQASR